MHNAVPSFTSLLFCILQIPRIYHASVALPKLANWPFPWDKYKHLKTYVDTVKKTDAFKKTDYGEEKILNGWRPKLQQ
jgi:hypothetical protein